MDDNERALIGALKDYGETEGLIGGVAGTSLKNLPSSLYWTALRQFGILASPTLGRDDAIELEARSRIHDADDEGQLDGGWSPTLPPAPEGFPHETGGGFHLTSFEAGWLRDRLLEGADGSLLSHFVAHRPSDESAAPWDDPARLVTDPSSVSALEHAELFSFSMHGAALLYNLLLAEAYEAAKYDTIVAPVEQYRQRLREWQQERNLLHDRIIDWDRSDFWATVSAENPRVAQNSRHFIDSWLDNVRETSDNAADDERSRTLILRREHQHKRSQSRLNNHRLLQTWQGSSGSGRLVFRWPTVRRILLDLHDGLERTDA